MDDEATHAPPDGLGPDGLRLWSDLTEGVRYRPDELVFLEQACRLSDRAAAIERELEGQPLMVTGSRGTLVTNPLLSELRMTRSEISRAVARIDVPPEPGELEDAAARRKATARKAARSRWHGTSKAAG